MFCFCLCLIAPVLYKKHRNSLLSNTRTIIMLSKNNWNPCHFSLSQNKLEYATLLVTGQTNFNWNIQEELEIRYCLYFRSIIDALITNYVYSTANLKGIFKCEYFYWIQNKFDRDFRRCSRSAECILLNFPSGGWRRSKLFCSFALLM